LLAPDEDVAGWRYTLYVEGDLPANAAECLDRRLRANPQYSHCRELGQLQPSRVFRIAGRGFETFTSRLISEGKRLGDIKPTPLSRSTGWSKIFAGA
jgi:type IV secretory pathway protease TraF